MSVKNEMITSQNTSFPVERPYQCSQRDPDPVPSPSRARPELVLRDFSFVGTGRDKIDCFFYRDRGGIRTDYFLSGQDLIFPVGTGRDRDRFFLSGWDSSGCPVENTDSYRNEKC